MEKVQWRKWLADYFSFTAKERLAVYGMLFFIFMLFILPQFIPPVNEKMAAEDSLAIAAIRNWQEDSMQLARSRPEFRRSRGPDDHSLSKAATTQYELFYFDPNSASEADWLRLGLHQRTVQTILKYRSRGGWFRHPGDIDRVYGIPKEKAAQLKPYIRIAADNIVKPAGLAVQLPGRKQPGKLQLNNADSMQLVRLPGIGPTIAARILGFRERLGGFYEIEQLKEVYGFRDSLLQLALPFIELGTDSIRKLDLNLVSLEDLNRHPYFRGPLAAAIIAYRKEHGVFRSVSDLLMIHLVKAETYKKIAPYCKIR